MRSLLRRVRGARWEAAAFLVFAVWAVLLVAGMVRALVEAVP